MKTAEDLSKEIHSLKKQSRLLSQVVNVRKLLTGEKPAPLMGNDSLYEMLCDLSDYVDQKKVRDLVIAAYNECRNSLVVYGLEVPDTLPETQEISGYYKGATLTGRAGCTLLTGKAADTAKAFLRSKEGSWYLGEDGSLHIVGDYVPKGEYRDENGVCRVKVNPPIGGVDALPLGSYAEKLAAAKPDELSDLSEDFLEAVREATGGSPEQLQGLLSGPAETIELPLSKLTIKADILDLSLNGERLKVVKGLDELAYANVEWNSASKLPPVDCPLVLRGTNAIFKAHRAAFAPNKESDLVYILEDGERITGRFEWTYP